MNVDKNGVYHQYTKQVVGEYCISETRYKISIYYIEKRSW